MFEVFDIMHLNLEISYSICNVFYRMASLRGMILLFLISYPYSIYPSYVISKPPTRIIEIIIQIKCQEDRVTFVSN